MKYSYLWLKELSKTKKSPAQLADLLTMHAFELEEMKREGKEIQLVFDILANRGHDALSHIGMAQEICAVEGRNFFLKLNFRKFLKLNFRNKLQIDIKDKNLCWRYIGAVLENVEVKSSPQWLVDRLLVCGIKPINNIVDITNYVMLETGQPLHAFDAKRVSEGSTFGIVVRRARKGEKIKLLDEKEYELGENNLVIADSKKALALAGVMGGYDSSVTKKTASIILESANFDATNIRKTRTRHNIITESSYRFERAIDPNLAETAAARAIELLQKFGGKNVKLTAYNDIYPKKVKPWTVNLDTNYVKSLLGENIPDKKIKNILENLGIAVKTQKNIFNCEIPTIRIDLKTQEDLIEEIGRIYGYENIPAKAPVVELTSPPVNEKRVFEDKLRDILVALGFSEMLNYSFYSKDDIEKCGLGVEGHYELANPMNPDQQFMRAALVPNILKNIILNQKNFPKIEIFEIGRKYKKENEKVNEIDCFVGVIIDDSAKENLFFTLKGKLEALLENIDIQNYKFGIQNSIYKYWHPTRTAVIFVGDQKIGKIGEVNPQVLEKYGISQRVALFGLKMEKIMGLANKEKVFESISKFPSVKRDVSMFIPENARYADIEKKIRDTGGKMVISVELFDIFEKADEKSLALRIEIGSREKTLTSAEIDEVMKKIVSKLEKDLKVKVRK